MKRELLLVLMVAGALAAAAPTGAQEAGEKPAEEEAVDLAPDEIAEAEKEGKVRLQEEVTVVSASRAEQKIVDAPATMSVITSETMEQSPATNIGDTLRTVPGVNVIQTGARDFNVTARQATSTLATSQLVMVDGRSVYLDFFGLVLWDFVPSPSSGEIDQIEVVRGPASVVWGANAVNGVVNFITKRPRANEGLNIILAGGLFDRDDGSRESEGNGYQVNGGFTFADAVNDTWSYKLSAGYFYSEPYSRPVGQVPLTCHPLGVSPCRTDTGAAVEGGYPLGGAFYPADANQPGAFENDGTSQPKFDLRVDQDLSNGGRISYEGGYGGTQGIVHTGIGPFDLQSGSYMAYGRVMYTKDALRVGGFVNLVDAEAPNLLVVDPDTLRPVILGFKTQTYDFEVGNTTVLGGSHVLTYGGNVRRNNFDISLAQGPDRNEFGVYGQWEYFVNEFRFSAGLRTDKFGNLDDWVWSPRVALMYKPTPDQSIRLSYNRAFVSPSFINNYLDQNIQFPTPVDLTPLTPVLPPPLQPLVPPPFLLTVNAFGNPDLEAQVTDAFEIAYTATLGSTTLGAAAYLSRSDRNINFTYLFPPGTPGYPPPTLYSPQNPARGVTLPTPTTPAEPITLSPLLMGVLEQVPPQFGGPILLPDKAATYLNLGPIENRGIELSIDHRFNSEVSFFANYSLQDTPKILSADSDQIPYPVNEVGLPSEHRFNGGVAYNGDTFFGNVSVNYASEALWVDVLTATYAGFTDPYTMINATVGVKLSDGKVMLSLKGTNLANETIQQHIFGDILKRSIVGEVRLFVK